MKPVRRTWTVGLLSTLLTAVLGAGCTAFEPMIDARTGEGPRREPGDRVYELAVRVVDALGHPLEDVRTQVRVVRYASASRELPRSEFTMVGWSGESGEPGLVRYRFPGPSDPHAFDVIVRTTDGREVANSQVYLGQWWPSKNHGGRKWDLRSLHEAHGFPETGEGTVEITFPTG